MNKNSIYMFIKLYKFELYGSVLQHNAQKR